MAILILGLLPFVPAGNFRGLVFYPAGKILFWALVAIFFLLTYIGAKPVEVPFIFLGQILRVLYFRYFFIAGGLNKA
jgi:ubiquinol-cytochrome c reductase cytochrome b subunit